MSRRKIKKPRKIVSEEAKNLSKAEKREIEVLNSWEKSRKMGIVKYVLLKGTLAWSLLTIGIFMLISIIQSKFLINYEMLMYFLKMYIVFLLMGTVFGLVSWLVSERKYLKSKNLK